VRSRLLDPKTKIEFVESKSDNAFSYFTFNFLQFSPILLQFQSNGPNTAVSMPVDRLW